MQCHLCDFRVTHILCEGPGASAAPAGATMMSVRCLRPNQKTSSQYELTRVLHSFCA